MKTIFARRFSAVVLLCTSTAVGCDPGDDGDAELLADDAELIAQQDERDALDELAVEAPDPSALFEPCPDSANFCFWYATGYNGKPLALPAGDFAIKDFGKTVYSALKRKWAYRVKLFSHPNFTGSCQVLGPTELSAQSGNLLGARSARRMEPNEGGC